MTNAIGETTKNKTKYSETLVNTLIDLGVSSIFGYPGAAVLSIYNELSKHTDKIKHYLVRHEQSAVHAAEGYARVSGNPGVVLVTSGPGFTNTITGIANAYADSTPLVILAGDVSTTSSGNKIFQNVDIKSLTSSCVKKTYIIEKTTNIEQVLKDAFRTANSGIKGPVVIIMPRNILESEYFENTTLSNEKMFDTKDYSLEIERLYSLIKSSKKPLILVGGGCTDAAKEVFDFAKLIKAPVATTLMGIGNYPSESELYTGMIGINGTCAANTAIANCDLLIALGTAFSDRSTCKNKDFCSNAKIVSINIQKISNDFELEIISDIKDFLIQFSEKQYKFIANTSWLSQIKTLKEESDVNSINSNTLHSSYVLKTLSDFTKDLEPIVVTDVGQHQMLTAQFFKFNKPRKFITSGGLGTMGYGLPAGIGAHVACPDNLVINITGDGSYQMNLQELATCREHNIPLKIIIMNNGYLGMVRQLQEKIYKNRYQVKMINPDFVKIAEAYDLFAIRVNTKDELIPAIEKAIKYNGTAIVDIMIDSFEEI